MKGFDTLHVKSAVRTRNHFNKTLNRSHLTTMDFGQIVPLFVEELIPGDKYHVKARFFSRTAPLVKPTYGKFAFKTMSCFVPYHQLAYDAEAFIAGKTTWEGKTPALRYILYTDLLTYLGTSTYGVTINGSATDYDYSVINSGGTTIYLKFTDYGKFVIKILNSLGYTIPQNVDFQPTSAWVTAFGTKNLSAMPLLAYAKAYNDYMSQSQRFNTSALTDLLRNIKYDTTVSGYNVSTHRITSAGLNVIFSNIKLCYENDYFLSAWQNPNAPLNAFENVSNVYVPEGVSASQAVSGGLTNNILTVGQSLSTNIVINQRGLDFLRSFDDWVRRNNYSGSRVVQQIYSRFGIKTEDYKSHYVHVIDTKSFPVQVGDVTAQASSSMEVLGDYAGKAILSTECNFGYDSSDYGILFNFGYFTISPMNAYGFDRLVLRTNPLDFYTPEFDGLGADAISFGELYTDPKNTVAADTSLDDAVYGFTERYNAYRFGRDKITGEFRNYDNAADMNTWHTGRLLTAVRGASQMIAQSSAMNTMNPYSSEFNRIFSVTSGVDHFYMVAQFEVDAVRPMMSLNQVPKLGEGDTVVPRNGNEIN